MYPLRFQPVFRQYLWGGRRLATELGKAIGDGDDFAESWEIVDHGDDQSVVAHGDLAGKTLHQLVVEQAEALFGRDATHRQFPLLFKLLDAHQPLSVQVHPNDAQAAQLDPPDLGKTEAWFILAAEPGSKIYAGLKSGFDRSALAREIANQTAELCLHEIYPQVGDCIFIPAGTVHALGAGLLVAEIQQASDTTYRVYDWNRVGKDGRPRDLHVAAALDVIDYAQTVHPQSPQPTDTAECQQLVACDKFVFNRWDISDEVELATNDQFQILVVVSGSIDVSGDPAGIPLGKGETVLVPADCQSVRLRPQQPTTVLQIHLP